MTGSWPYIRFTAGRRIPALFGTVVCILAAAWTSPGSRECRAEVTPPPPTFGSDVAPILFRHCTACHREGGVAPFPLTTYEQARRRAQEIAEVTRDRVMPPWQPTRGYGSFDDERGLGEDEIATLGRWLAAGRPAGDLSIVPDLPPLAPTWQLGEPDLTVELKGSYTVPADGPDLFRNLVLPLPLTTRRHVAAVELRPGHPIAVHHATLLADTTGLARQLDALDEEPGYAGMEGGVSPGGHFIGWTPGKRPRGFGDGLAWEVEPGTDLVLQLHLVPSGKPEDVRPTVGLHFTERAPTNAPAMLHLGSMTLDVPAGEASHVIRDELTLPVDVEALSVYPHAHYLCRTMRAWAVPPSGGEVALLRIEDWDFNWQDEYHYRRPVPLPAGTVVHMEFVYDNSASNLRNPNSPPETVTWGPRTTDAMGDLWLKVVPRRSLDLATLRRTIEAVDRKRFEEGLRAAIVRRGDSPWARARLGHLLVGRGAHEEALPHLELAAARLPDAWSVRHDLGVARAELGETATAARHFVHALAANPAYLPSLAGLAATLVLLGRAQEAVALYEQVIAERPNDAQMHNNLGFALDLSGRRDEAETQYRRALALDPDLGEAERNLARLRQEREPRQASDPPLP